jgi:hypothetical protein
MSNPESKGMNGDIANSSLTEKEKIAWQTRRWKNRRRMAWLFNVNLTSIILLYFFAPIPDARLTIIAEPLSMITFGFRWYCWCVYGFTTTFEKYKMGK